MSSSERFGIEWSIYNRIQPHYYDQYQQQFLNWIYPIAPNYFKHKTVLDAGCGMGRNSYWCVKWGAKKVVAFDKDRRSVGAAQENLPFPQVEVIEQDIYHLPWKNEFDFAFSIGVIHHLKDPKSALHQIYQTLKPGGEILLWVYSQVGFENTLIILNPIRRHLTSKLPPRLLHFLSYTVSIPFYLYLHILQPSKPYYQQLQVFSFSHVHSIIFDQLLPDIANYYRQEEARDLLAAFEDVTVHVPPNKNGWIVRGKKANNSQQLT